MSNYGTTSHPQCGPDTGHTCSRPSRRTCVENGCDAEAGTRWGPYWCPDHDAERLDRITKNLDSIMGENRE